MRFYKYTTDGMRRLRFDCETEGSQSFKANRGRFLVTVTLEEVTGLGANFRELRLVARREVPPRGYTFSRIHHYGESCLRAYQEGRVLPGGLDENGVALPEPEAPPKPRARR